MVFALIGEQFGFFGSAVVLGAYIVLFAAGIEIAGITREPFGKLRRRRASSRCWPGRRSST